MILLRGKIIPFKTSSLYFSPCFFWESLEELPFFWGGCHRHNFSTTKPRGLIIWSRAWRGICRSIRPKRRVFDQKTFRSKLDVTFKKLDQNKAREYQLPGRSIFCKTKLDDIELVCQQSGNMFWCFFGSISRCSLGRFYFIILILLKQWTFFNI